MRAERARHDERPEQRHRPGNQLAAGERREVTSQARTFRPGRLRYGSRCVDFSDWREFHWLFEQREGAVKDVLSCLSRACSNDMCRNTGHDGKRRDVSCDDRASGNDAALSQRYPRQN